MSEEKFRTFSAPPPADMSAHFICERMILLSYFKDSPHISFKFDNPLLLFLKATEYFTFKMCPG